MYTSKEWQRGVCHARVRLSSAKRGEIANIASDDRSNSTHFAVLSLLCSELAEFWSVRPSVFSHTNRSSESMSSLNIQETDRHLMMMTTGRV